MDGYRWPRGIADGEQNGQNAGFFTLIALRGRLTAGRLTLIAGFLTFNAERNGNLWRCRVNKGTTTVMNAGTMLSRPSDWMTNMFDLEQFRAAAQMGVFERIVIVASLGKFMVEGVPRKDSPGVFEKGVRLILCTSRRKRPRNFSDPSTALRLLFEMGVKNVEVHMARWIPERASEWGRKRPDMAERLRFAHEYARPEGGE